MCLYFWCEVTHIGMLYRKYYVSMQVLKMSNVNHRDFKLKHYFYLQNGDSLCSEMCLKFLYACKA